MAAPSERARRKEGMRLRREQRRYRSIRLACWTFVAAGVAFDVSTTGLTFGLLYFPAVVAASLALDRRDAYRVAAGSIAARVLFGPSTEELKAWSVAVVFSPGIAVLLNVAVALLSFGGLTVLLVRVREQKVRIADLDRELELDPLTGAANRRALQRVLAAAEALGRPLSLLVVDADDFKKINDRFGHAMGDVVLCELVRTLQATVREGDLVARTGGEEFVVVLPETRRADAVAIAERICENVRQMAVPAPDGPVRPTVSVGCASGLPTSALLSAADAALYEAKSCGRDRVRCAA